MGAADREARNQDDFDLMRRIAARDPDALAALYDCYGGMIFALGLRMLRDRGDAEDFLTDVFWELWNRADRYDATRGAPVTYLMTLARSRAIDRQRSASHRNKPMLASLLETDVRADTAAVENPAADAQRDERRSMVRSAMERLDPAQRQAVELSFFDGLSHSQIAAKLDKPLGTVKTFIRQGLIRLRDCLRNE